MPKFPIDASRTVTNKVLETLSLNLLLKNLVFMILLSLTCKVLSNRE